MSDIRKSGLPEDDQHPVRTYRVVALDDDGRVNASTTLPAIDDEAAKRFARRMAKGFAVELWDGLRFIEHYDSRETASYGCG
ncbi:hypothetical protein [Methylobacterium gnaphalii]|uniref:Uncharacterized protein n=1 Tax=Methylobacterium gnaphalii TaxID=1010610 RepID=A0A512JH50_9HYPH|nr:hypothetical protein [Methylobacterium gnaphalii]GEP09253.1 hypothetical protein MGN01_10980 [Methylobacterium gnaphalii]GJD69033.1 hypothetical protein MMMDOFMJ_1959 [Methylobacterium gnaphalii]